MNPEERKKMLTILEVKQNSPEWYKAREGKVTGSIVEGLLTKGLDHALKQNLNRTHGNFYTQRGHILEEEAVELYEQIHDVKLQRPGMVINDLYPNAACSPDAIDLSIECLIEIKCFIAKNHNAIQNETLIPFKIMSQLQFHMMICELQVARLVMYNPDIEDHDQAYREIEVKANKAIQGNMARKLQS